MEENRIFSDLCAYVLLDSELRVVKLENYQDNLFFGIPLIIDANFSTQFSDDKFIKRQVLQIIDAITRSREQHRRGYTNYISVCKDGQIPVALHIDNRADGSVCLCALAVDMGDLARTSESCEYALGRSLERKIYDNIPVGIEIYDGNGRLIDLNSYEMVVLGVEDKHHVIGLDLFANPNIPDDVKAKLRAGENAQFAADYDFELAKTYYHCPLKSEKRHFMVAIVVLHNSDGKVSKYIFTVQDISERMLYQRQYEALYKQNSALLDLIPLGVGLYTSNGELIYCNMTLGQIESEDSRSLHFKINPLKNPAIPAQLKTAIREMQPIELDFAYDVCLANINENFKTDFAPVLQVKCFGRPIAGLDGTADTYMLVVEDVTEEMIRDKNLQHSRRRTALATKEADIMIWEFDVKNQLFFAENEPINDYDPELPITIEDYINTIHEQDRWHLTQSIERMMRGEDFTYNFEARVRLPGKEDWQYCAVSGSPYSYDSEGRALKYVGTRKNNTQQHKRKLLQENILNALPIPVHIKDIENNSHYVFCNEESTRMFGSKADSSIYDVMSKQMVARIEKTDKEVFKTGEPYFGFERIELLDGRAYDTIVRKSIIYDGDKRLLLNVRWDQSLENDLKRSAKMLTMSMEVMNAYTWFYDLTTKEISYGEGFERNGRNQQLNDTLPKFLGNMHPQDGGMFEQKLVDLIEGKSQELCIEYRIDLNACGQYEWWETRGLLEISRSDPNEKYMIGMSVNIDAHKKTEIMLRENSKELDRLIVQNEMVLNNTNSGLAYITVDYIVQWENISSCSSSLSYEAYKKGELCYKSAHCRSTPCENCVLQRTMVSKQLEQIKFVLEDQHQIEVFATPVFRPDGDLDGIVIRVDDVTERERMIDELKHAKALAEQSDKLKSAFLANMSHEIRTPLNAIVGFSELLITSEDNEDRDEYIQIINTNNELLLKLINDILDLSKIEAGSVELKYEDFDLSEYFDNLVSSMLQRVTNPNVNLIAHNPYPACLVHLDRNRVAQLITNYVTNAIKYTPRGSIEMGYECVDNGVYIYVKDSGIGISNEKKNKVFHRFEKLDEFAQGTGLGLSICKAIAESMGGSVGFESESGVGSTFWAQLPCEYEVINRVADQSPMVEGFSEPTHTYNLQASSRKTILIAEDIPSNYLLISALLKKHYDLLHAQDGEQAVEMAKSKHVDLLLMDMKMPKMDGLKATVEIRKFDKFLPIVALTAHAFDSDRQAAINAGCNDYLSKPIDKAKLMSVLRKYCNWGGI